MLALLGIRKLPYQALLDWLPPKVAQLFTAEDLEYKIPVMVRNQQLLQKVKIFADNGAVKLNWNFPLLPVKQSYHVFGKSLLSIEKQLDNITQ